jgi:L-iditol 2-dehydrogenase
VSLEEGALAEPFASAVQAVEELTPFNVGDTVLVSGPGPIGLLSLALVISHRCRTIVAGTAGDAVRLAVAGALGADVTVDVSREDLDRVIERETGGRGVDIAIEAAGAEASLIACLRAVRRLGRIVQIGIAGRDVTVPFDTILYKQLQVFGALGHSFTTWDRVMRILGQRKVDLSPIITHKLPLSRWREGFDLCETKRGVKVLLSYDEP